MLSSLLWCQQTGQTGGDGTGQCGGSDREVEDEREAKNYHGQPVSSCLRQAEVAQEHVQPQTHPAMYV